MWVNRRFVATRDPSRGGLCMISVSEEVDQNMRDEISDNCIELISEDYDHCCTGIYSLHNGKTVFMVAKKVPGSRKESRPHDVIRGAVVEPEEMNTFLEYYLSNENFEKIFYPDKLDPDKPEVWRFPVLDGFTEESSLPEFWDGMNLQAIIGLYNAVKEVEKSKLKVLLDVPEGKENIVLAALYTMAIQNHGNLFIVSRGECTLRSPDIIIGKQLRYCSSAKYRKLTVEEFIHMGSSMVKNNNPETDGQDNPVEELLTFCYDYLISSDITDHKLYDLIDDFHMNHPDDYRTFIRKLKSALRDFKDYEYYSERYLKLLYVAFKIQKDNFSSELEVGPYDFYLMINFIKELSRNKRKCRLMMTDMFEILFQDCLDNTAVRASRDAAVSVVGDM